MEQLKIAWKVDSKDDDTPTNYTCLRLDDFDNSNSIDDVRFKLEKILQQEFEADRNYIVYDFYHISNKIFDKVVVNPNRQLKDSSQLFPLVEADYLYNSTKNMLFGVISGLSIITILGFIAFWLYPENQSFNTAAIDSGVTPKDIAFGVKKVKTYSNSMATHALSLNKQCVEKAKKDACVEYKRLYDTFLNGGLNIDKKK